MGGEGTETTSVRCLFQGVSLFRHLKKWKHKRAYLNTRARAHVCVCTCGLIGKDEIYDTGERRTAAGGKSSSRCEVGSSVREQGEP